MTKNCEVCGTPYSDAPARMIYRRYCSKACRLSIQDHLKAGDKINRWTVLAFVGVDADYGRQVLARCECGAERVVRERAIKYSGSKSCGCLRKDQLKKESPRITHGKRYRPEYKIYIGAKGRCTNTKVKSYPDYGGRGIEFRYRDFEEFWNDLGPRPSAKHEINRIDNDSHYMPGNCEWVTRDVNAKNRRKPKSSGPP